MSPFVTALKCFKLSARLQSMNRIDTKYFIGGLVIGIAIGTALHSVAVGIAIGVAFGLSLGSRKSVK
ncbi:hypothetical protein LX99_01298 [Mucilaginibacter oryzae]|uniref:Glycine zipper family protein n=1 Tax=Mucilaginibacter oryzae TaxID=468058 RepID=A0A316HKQ6_9SPHI|nr:hypothetical protein LX99_01298 [Mucilaginibacter oryzae]